MHIPVVSSLNSIVWSDVAVHAVLSTLIHHVFVIICCNAFGCVASSVSTDPRCDCVSTRIDRLELLYRRCCGVDTNQTCLQHHLLLFPWTCCIFWITLFSLWWYFCRTRCQVRDGSDQSDDLSISGRKWLLSHQIFWSNFFAKFIFFRISSLMCSFVFLYFIYF